jgi:3-hydroxyacyl-[acyl-carrier-protein] dehydratase
MRYRFVDKIIALEPGVSIECQRTWPEDLEIFEDHFPEFPVVPGVLLTEMMGQAAGLCLSSRADDASSAMLIQIKNAAFREWVKPGELLQIKAEIVSSQSRLARIKASTERDGALVASTELLFSFETKGKLGLPDIDPVLVDYWDRTKTRKEV